jgi:hypothetical protein
LGPPYPEFRDDVKSDVPYQTNAQSHTSSKNIVHFLPHARSRLCFLQFTAHCQHGCQAAFGLPEKQQPFLPTKDPTSLATASLVLEDQDITHHMTGSKGPASPSRLFSYHSSYNTSILSCRSSLHLESTNQIPDHELTISQPLNLSFAISRCWLRVSLSALDLREFRVCCMALWYSESLAS